MILLFLVAPSEFPFYTLFSSILCTQPHFTLPSSFNLSTLSRTGTVLAKSDAIDGKQSIVDILKSWQAEEGGKKFNEMKFNSWVNDGTVFWMDQEGTEKLLQMEAKKEKKIIGLPSKKYTAADIYVNLAKNRYLSSHY